MLEAQQEHALAIEHFVPRIAALRSELCPSQMSENCFWKIYFVLLHSRLNKHDAELLSTPQVVDHGSANCSSPNIRSSNSSHEPQTILHGRTI